MRLSAVSPVNQARYDKLIGQVAAATAAGHPATVRYLKRELAKLDSGSTVPPMGVPATIPIGVPDPFTSDVTMVAPTTTGFGGLPMPLLLGGRGC